MIVTGASGMLGQNVARAARARGHEVHALQHHQLDISNAAQVFRAVERLQPDVVINCAGKRHEAHPFEMIAANALGPHVLAKTGARLIQASTDGVFSGQRHLPYAYLPDDHLQPPDPSDLYGRTKLVGEVAAENVTVVRTSFVGVEDGLLAWLLAREPGELIQGWTNVHWNGGVVTTVAERLVRMAEEWPEERLVHLAAMTVVSKADLLEACIGLFHLPLKFERVEEPRLLRVLDPSSGYVLPNIDDELARYAATVQEVAHA